MKEKILTMRNGKAVWGPAPKDTDPIDPSRLPEGYPYKTGVTIEWDGNTEGLTAVQNSFYKVSDNILDDETLKNSVITYYQNGSFTDKVVSEMWDSMVSYGLITENYAVLGEFCIITRADNLTVNNFVLPTAGVYFVCRSGIYTTKLSSETIHPMSEEFLPAGVGGGCLLMVNYGDTLSHSYDEIFSHIQSGGFAYLVLFGMYYFPLQGVMNNNIAFAGHNPMDNRQYFIFTVCKNDGETTVIQQTGTFTMDSDFAQS